MLLNSGARGLDASRVKSAAWIAFATKKGGPMPKHRTALEALSS